MNGLVWCLTMCRCVNYALCACVCVCLLARNERPEGSKEYLNKQTNRQTNKQTDKQVSSISDKYLCLNFFLNNNKYGYAYDEYVQSNENECIDNIAIGIDL